MVSIDKTREFVFKHGALWERSLFSYLFDGGSLQHLHHSLLAYKNEDGGFGHGMEHDIKCPDSNPLALEFLLTVVRETGIPAGNLFDNSSAWVERNRAEDGSLKNPPTLHNFPYAPWWSENGQTVPASTVGNLRRLGLSTPVLEESTAKWAAEHLNVEQIANNDWLFMAFQAFDYYLTLEDTADTRPLREATIQNIIKLAEKAPEKSFFTLCHYISDPHSEMTQAVPPALLDRLLTHLSTTQREDGGWNDEHDLLYWQPYMSTLILLTLKNHNRL
ncbi:hypothetical protein CIG75_14235 [Tumebacillus algifaecis]|uniref:Squalene cyclase C-terminal domain-containing protein n=1 Tax=Tumebacillus algifaecis TaxID=1214604 RepID=A0A223D3L5_9BACL|nr:hypothetical protein [Tumebacillus algifaecis]ASS76007.1 hypothetical protein CIG75_14235 [Tumebacillus algifaecis]